MDKTKTVTIQVGGIGQALAIVLSYTAHKSILWAIVAGAFSWFYVIYYALFY